MAYFVTKALSISSFRVHFEELGTHGQDCGLVPSLSSSSFPPTTSSDKLFSGFMIGRSPENKCIFNTTHSSFDKPNLSQIHGFEGRGMITGATGNVTLPAQGRAARGRAARLRGNVQFPPCLQRHWKIAVHFCGTSRGFWGFSSYPSDLYFKEN